MAFSLLKVRSIIGSDGRSPVYLALKKNGATAPSTYSGSKLGGNSPMGCSSSRGALMLDPSVHAAGVGRRFWWSRLAQLDHSTRGRARPRTVAQIVGTVRSVRVAVASAGARLTDEARRGHRWTRTGVAAPQARA